MVIATAIAASSITDAMLVHQSEPFSFFLRLSHDHRQVKAWRHGPKKQLRRLRQNDPLREFSRLLARRQHQFFLSIVELPEPGDFVDLIRRHVQANLPLNHVQHRLGRSW